MFICVMLGLQGYKSGSRFFLPDPDWDLAFTRIRIQLSQIQKPSQSNYFPIFIERSNIKVIYLKYLALKIKYNQILF